MEGYFFSFEGPDGAGKTTIVQLVEDFLVEQGFQVVSTREPGGIDIAEKIRAVILHPDHKTMDARTEALLYAAARRQHLVEKVVPALKDGKIVLCDRFLDSSLAYQGFARGLGIDEVLAINEFAINGCMPLLTVYFDVDPKVGLGRISKNQAREVNRLDMESLQFHYKVREGYLLLAERFADRIVKIDANRSVNEVFKETANLIVKSIKNSGR